VDAIAFQGTVGRQDRGNFLEGAGDRLDILAVGADAEGGGFPPAFDAVMFDAQEEVGGLAGGASTDGEGEAFVDGEGLETDLHGDDRNGRRFLSLR
jgi:hypothetical protein